MPPHETPPPKPRRRHWGRRILILLLLIGLFGSLIANGLLLVEREQYYAGAEPPDERFYDGDRTAAVKVARIEVSGTISPPFTGRILKALERAAEDDAVQGLLLVVDSPGGLVADSHEIYHRVKEFSAKKPVVVSMKRLAASGGLYVAMGCGPEGQIFAEPTTWTGSIGVIIPRYDVTELGEKIGIRSDSLKTGELKDSLNPLRPLSPKEEEVWRVIMADSFDRFIGVIADNRKPLDREKVRELATGQVYTAEQAKASGLVDTIGYEEDALAVLKQRMKQAEIRVVEYEFPLGLIDLIAPAAKAVDSEARWQTALDRAAPKAYYHYAAQNPFADLPALQLP